MSICKIGETKVINGKRYRKQHATILCKGCAFRHQNGGECLLEFSQTIKESIEEGGSECHKTIWILADDQPEAPTATTPRDEVREQRRFQAAVAAMQGMLADEGESYAASDCAQRAVKFADALLAELDRTVVGK